MHLLHLNTKPKRGGKNGDPVACLFGRILERGRGLLSRNTSDPTVGGLRDEKQNCSTRRGCRVGTGFMEFPQTPRGRIFSLLEFYSHFKCFSMFRLV